jgi:hypothetical protein
MTDCPNLKEILKTVTAHIHHAQERVSVANVSPITDEPVNSCLLLYKGSGKNI